MIEDWGLWGEEAWNVIISCGGVGREIGSKPTTNCYGPIMTFASLSKAHVVLHFGLLHPPNNSI